MDSQPCGSPSFDGESYRRPSALSTGYKAYLEVKAEAKAEMKKVRSSLNLDLSLASPAPPTEEVLDRKKQSAHKTLLAKRLQTSSRPVVVYQRKAHMDLAGVQRVTCSQSVALGLHSLTHSLTSRPL